MDRNEASGNHDRGAHSIMNDFELQDFINDANFDQFIDIIRGENDDPTAAHFDGDQNSGSCFVDNQCRQITPDFGLFGYGHNTTGVSNAAPYLTTLPHFDGEMNNIGREENNEAESSGTTITATTNSTDTATKKPKVDRLRTLVSERKRRGRMKEKLFALRSLVPNITKMDKASIVGDAILYVQDLQKHAMKLEVEIQGLEASIEGSWTKQAGSMHSSTMINKFVADNYPLTTKRIIQIDVSQVKEKGFYVKVGGNKGVGVATSLYKAIESLASFNVLSSNLNSIISERFEITLNLNVKESEQEIINLPNLKLWVAGAFLNQGFELATCC